MIDDFVRKEHAILKGIAGTARGLCMDMVLRSRSGHIGLPLGATEILTLLYFGVMEHDPQESKWLNRDRFVLSAGHGSALLYSMLHLAGYELSIEELKNFRQLGSKTAGHPEFGLTPGVECTTGPLGQGLAMAVGMALAESHLAERFNEVGTQQSEHDARKAFQGIDHRTFVLAGDGCLMEGITAEATSLAGHLKLNKLVVFYDDNKITIDGKTEITFSEDVGARFRALGWNVFEVDSGNDFEALAPVLDQALEKTRLPRGSTGPSLVICRTIPGLGLKNWAGKAKVHGNPHSVEDVRAAKEEMATLGLDPSRDFFVPADVAAGASRLVSLRKQTASVWKDSLTAALATWEPQRRQEWQNIFGTDFVFSFTSKQLEEAKSSLATRQSSGLALGFASETLFGLIGGSADLAGSNNSTLPGKEFVQAGNYKGQNIHFGVREYAMAAICNGMALHSALRPFCATFAVFSDYMRPAIRLAALMKLPTVFVLTHDSYAVGEDGPTHQPMEHAASLRCIPGLQVYRPADGVETFAAWQAALNNTMRGGGGPSVLLLTRQKLDALDPILEALGQHARSFESVLRGVTLGAYLLKDHGNLAQVETQTKVTLISSGSEVADVLRAAGSLERRDKSLSFRVVSIPNFPALLLNPPMLNALIPAQDLTIGIEAGSTHSLAGLVGRNGFVFGLDHFGESAPAEKLKEHFELTEESLCNRILWAIGKK